MSDNVISVRKLGKRFGSFQALDAVSFSVQKGDIFGFIGRNGAGKTTVMRILSGLMRPDEGEIEILGRKMEGTGLYGIAGKVCFLPQNVRFDDNRSVREILLFYAGLKRANGGMSLKLAGELGLDIKRKVCCLSPGQQRKLQLLISTLGGPEILILDEPTAGLDPLGVQQVREIIAELNSRGSTVFISSHVLAELDNLCSRVAVIEKGCILYEGLCNSIYEIEVDNIDTSLYCGQLKAFAEGYDSVEKKLYVHIERKEIPGILQMLYVNGIKVYGVKLRGLERFYSSLVREGA